MALSRWIIQSELLSLDLVAFLHHLISGLNGLRVHLVGPLGLDQVHHLLDYLYIGHLKITLGQFPKAILTRIALFWHTRRRSFLINITADILQS